MNGVNITLNGQIVTARPTGSLFWTSQSMLIVSDLHLGRTERIARQGGQIIPPYENTDTLTRLDDEIQALSPKTVVCLGDSFDDLLATGSLTDTERDWITRLQAGRKWIWVEGNHDPAPLDLGGTHRTVFALDGLTFRHISEAGTAGEISGHYHPKASIPARGRGLTRPCFLFDANRLILPAFGTYTGGMNVTRPPLLDMFDHTARVVLTGKTARLFPAYSAATPRKSPASSKTL